MTTLSLSCIFRICISSSVLACLCTVLTFAATPVSVSGTVVDTLGNPISGAVVHLKAQGLADTTGADGVFSITGTTSIRNQAAGLTGSAFIGNRLALTLGSRQHVAVDIFNAKGALISQACDQVLDAGVHSITVPTAGLGVGMLFVRVTTGAVQHAFKMVSNGNGKIRRVENGAADLGALAIVEAAAVDSLLCARYAYVPVSTALESSTATGIVITLKARGTKPYEFVSIPGGTFNMGADSLSQTPGTRNLRGDTIHTVTLSAFSMQVTEVTQEQYLAVTGTNPAYFQTELSNPVENVTWYEAIRFCNALSVLSGLQKVYDTTSWTADTSVKGYRLPTEAEWEYACKGGTTTNYYWGNESDSAALFPNSWNYLNSKSTTHPVATKTANAFGLYDMSGNVWQWCGDWLCSYSPASLTDPTGAVTGSIRVVRGGCWYSSISNLRSSYRYGYYPGYSNGYFGFRVVLRP